MKGCFKRFSTMILILILVVGNVPLSTLTVWATSDDVITSEEAVLPTPTPAATPVHTNSTGTWYYVQKGKNNWNYTGLVQSSGTGTWYYVQKGRKNWTHTGLVKHTNGVLYYVKKGCVD